MTVSRSGRREEFWRGGRETFAISRNSARRQESGRFRYAHCDRVEQHDSGDALVRFRWPGLKDGGRDRRREVFAKPVCSSERNTRIHSARGGKIPIEATICMYSTGVSWTARTRKLNLEVWKRRSRSTSGHITEELVRALVGLRSVYSHTSITVEASRVFQ